MLNQTSPLIFAPSNLMLAAHIAQIINNDALCPERVCAVHTQADKVRAELEKSPHQHPLAILLAAKPEELDLMVAMAAWFEDIPLILIIPDHRRKTLAIAHRLRPRYLVWPEINYREMRIVIRNIIDRRFKEQACWGAPKAPLLISGLSGRRNFLLQINRRKTLNARMHGRSRAFRRTGYHHNFKFARTVRSDIGAP